MIFKLFKPYINFDCNFKRWIHYLYWSFIILYVVEIGVNHHEFNLKFKICMKNKMGKSLVQTIFQDNS